MEATDSDSIFYV